MSDADLIVVGASARAACFSARRSGLRPYWIDLFGDYDLQTEFSGELVDASQYPQAILETLGSAPKVPFMFTGAMENHLAVLEQLEVERRLLGNSAQTCCMVRDPEQLSACFDSRNIACPRHSRVPQQSGLWLKKPIASAGGRHIGPYLAGEEIEEGAFLQEQLAGQSYAGIFLADASESCLLGVSRQLVGESFLNAEAYAYCGSIGPLATSEHETRQWQAIGQALSQDFGLEGLFCVDAILSDDTLYPIEINPRYSASVEVLELAAESGFVELHCQACAGSLPGSLPRPRGVMAKAYLYAAQDLRCPDDISAIYPWSEADQYTADIPRPGSGIQRGQPLMSILTEVKSETEAIPTLASMAEKLYSEFTVL